MLFLQMMAFVASLYWGQVPPDARVLLEPWKGPYGGIPPFDKVEVGAFKPALEAAMAENLAEIDQIANNTAAPTFANTIEALERSGDTYQRVTTIYSIFTGTMSTPELQSIEREMAPKQAAFRDRINQNGALFKRIKAVYDSPEKAKLSSEQQRLVWVYYNNFVRAGAIHDDAAKARVAAINQQLAKLFTTFNQNLLADESKEYKAADGSVVKNTRSSRRTASGDKRTGV